MTVDSRLSGLFSMKEASDGKAGVFPLAVVSVGVLAVANSAYCGPYSSNLSGATDLAEKVAKRSSTTRDPTECTANLVICFLRFYM